MAAARIPSHLRTTQAKRLWKKTAAEYDLSEHHLAVLDAACSAVDRMIQARALIDAEGITVEGLHGPGVHPAVAVERDARTSVVRAVRDLGLDDTDDTSPRR